jgi:phage terminase small subunit
MSGMEGNGKPLTAQQAKFVQEYIVDLNGTAAYMRAYPKSSEAAARSSAATLLASPSSRAAVAAAQQKRAGKVELTQEWVLRRLMEEAQYDGEGASHSARVRATELCGKHLGMLSDRSEVTVEDRRPTAVRIIRVGTSGDGGRAPVLEADGSR